MSTLTLAAGRPLIELRHLCGLNCFVLGLAESLLAASMVESGRLRRRKAVHLVMRARDHHQRLIRRYEAGAKASLPNGIHLSSPSGSLLGAGGVPFKFSDPPWRFYRPRCFLAVYLAAWCPTGPRRPQRTTAEEWFVTWSASRSSISYKTCAIFRAQALWHGAGSLPAPSWAPVLSHTSRALRSDLPTYAVSMPYLRINHHTLERGRRYESRCPLSRPS